MTATAVTIDGARISTDQDPIFKHHRWQATLRVLGIDEVKTVPYTPLSHPFVERTIGTVRREFLDQTLSILESGRLSQKAGPTENLLQGISWPSIFGRQNSRADRREGLCSQTAHSQLQLDLALQWSIQDTDGLMDLEFARHTKN